MIHSWSHSRSPDLEHVYDLIERTCGAAREELAVQGEDLAAAHQRISVLEARLDRYEMITEMLLRLCHARGVASEDEMLQVLRELDLEDGVEDGKWGRGQPSGEPAGSAPVPEPEPPEPEAR